MADLSRFLIAQEGVNPQALAELQAGAKQSHWMWFVFPQLAGLGRSDMARRYALSGLDEARAFLAHPVLGARLREATAAMLGWAGRRGAAEILGAVDSLKFASSMTLFEAAGFEAAGFEAAGFEAAGFETAGGGAPFTDALAAFHGGTRDARTLALLAPRGYSAA